mmetsp:Transcript_48472/g.35682  ORF Transcript_48472/g.35682 Transcript_48472/m.35682 type:complete len:104 (+) Transcript_48472:98-409(+)
MSNLTRKFNPVLKAAIEESARRIFGYNPITNSRSAAKLFKQKPIGPLVSNHYEDRAVTETIFRKLAPTFTTEQQDRREEKLLRLRRKNKGPPKKGQGKRNNKK